MHTPSEVKAAVTGSGTADKAQVGAMVTRLLRLTATPRPADAADALALAICQVWRGSAQARLTAAVAKMVPSMTLEHTYDPDTLNEVYADPDAVRTRIAELRRDLLEAPDEIAELLARADLVDVLRGIGDLDDALDEAHRAADRAEIAGTAAQQHLARLRLAHVHQRRGEFVEANLTVVELEGSPGRLRAGHRGAHPARGGAERLYSQQNWTEAQFNFAAAIALRETLELSADENAASYAAIEAVRRKLAELNESPS